MNREGHRDDPRFFAPQPALIRPLAGIAVLVAWALALTGCLVPLALAAAEKNHTMVMFVGEDLGVVSIASGREEGAWLAPAVAKVVNREEFLAKGRTSLAEVLELTPGFHMAPREAGSMPYLRGIPNSALFLYDTVSICSEMSKSLHPLDEELSLAPVKRIEIIRGPGSVLWGPDAFAGVVNIVPMSGKDLNGVQSGIFGGAPGSELGAYVNMGLDRGWWDGFLSLTARQGRQDDRRVNVTRFFGQNNEPVPPAQRYGRQWPDIGEYLDSYGSISLGSGFSLSGKISHYRKPYSVFEQKGQFGWIEEQCTDWGYVKLEAHRELAEDFGLRLTGSYQWTIPETKVIDKKLSQSEKTGYVELVCDKGTWQGKGLLTVGLSHRHKEINGAPIWNAYFPDFLTPDNTTFLPQLTKVDYDTGLCSFFAQYVHKVGPFDLMGGLRYDNHDSYQDHFSYNGAVVWSRGDNWAVKMLCGTAFRTPFSRQLLSGQSPDLEKITSISAQLSYRTQGVSFGLTAFRNKLGSHIMEDPYAGLSEPNEQTITGVEFEGRASLRWNLAVEGNVTLMDNTGPDETYRLLDYVFVSPDGQIIKHYKGLNYPYDPGPKTLANISVMWDPCEQIRTYLRLGYNSSYSLIAPRNEAQSKVDSAWVAGGSFIIKRFPFQNTQLQFLFKNLTNNHYHTPGIYSLTEAPGVSMEAWLRVFGW